MLKLLSEKRNFTAIIGANDYIAIGALSACSQKEIKVPEDVSVVGFTGDEIGAYTVPPLTTMVQPIEEIGAKAIEILLAKIRDPNRPVERVLLPPGLLQRDSVKKG
jgi:LacI family transcriptional regulator